MNDVADTKTNLDDINEKKAVQRWNKCLKRQKSETCARVILCLHSRIVQIKSHIKIWCFCSYCGQAAHMDSRYSRTSFSKDLLSLRTKNPVSSLSSDFKFTELEKTCWLWVVIVLHIITGFWLFLSLLLFSNGFILLVFLSLALT